jgi:hypothetical protein
MDRPFEPAPRRCADLVCRRSGSCRRPFASSCLTSPTNHDIRRQRIAEKLDQFLRDRGIDPDGPPPPDALPIEETLAIIIEEAGKRRAARRNSARTLRRRGKCGSRPSA